MLPRDFDLLILTDNRADLAFEEEIRGLLLPLELETNRVLSFFVCNRKTWNSPLYRAMPFRENVDKEGVLC